MTARDVNGQPLPRFQGPTIDGTGARCFNCKTPYVPPFTFQLDGRRVYACRVCLQRSEPAAAAVVPEGQLFA